MQQPWPANQTPRSQPWCFLCATDRHPQPEPHSQAEPPGLHLADKGVAQAEAAAQRIAALESVAAVYASPLERTRETARPIARVRKLRVRQSLGLIECDFGAWDWQEAR